MWKILQINPDFFCCSQLKHTKHTHTKPLYTLAHTACGLIFFLWFSFRGWKTVKFSALIFREIFSQITKPNTSSFAGSLSATAAAASRVRPRPGTKLSAASGLQHLSRTERWSARELREVIIGCIFIYHQSAQTLATHTILTSALITGTTPPRNFCKEKAGILYVHTWNLALKSREVDQLFFIPIFIHKQTSHFSPTTKHTPGTLGSPRKIRAFAKLLKALSRWITRVHTERKGKTSFFDGRGSETNYNFNSPNNGNRLVWEWERAISRGLELCTILTPRRRSLTRESFQKPRRRN